MAQLKNPMPSFDCRSAADCHPRTYSLGTSFAIVPLTRMKFSCMFIDRGEATSNEGENMYTQEELDEYMAEIREQVCSHCIERPPGGPPCAPHGKICGIELHLPEIVDVCHAASSRLIDPYIEHLHGDVCARCAYLNSKHCLCALDYLLPLAIQAIEDVDDRKKQMTATARV